MYLFSAPTDLASSGKTSKLQRPSFPGRAGTLPASEKRLRRCSRQGAGAPRMSSHRPCILGEGLALSFVLVLNLTMFSLFTSKRLDSIAQGQRRAVGASATLGQRDLWLLIPKGLYKETRIGSRYLCKALSGRFVEPLQGSIIIGPSLPGWRLHLRRGIDPELCNLIPLG